MTIYQNQNKNMGYQEDSYDLEIEKNRITEGAKEIKKELLEKWQKKYTNAKIFPDKLKLMSPNVLDFLLSFENIVFYNQLEKKFSLNQIQRDALPQIVWKICLGKNWQDLENSVKTSLNISQFSEISEEIRKNILTKTKELSEKSFVSPSQRIDREEKLKSQLQKLTIQDALKKYPELGEQLVTGSRIKLKNFPDMVRPSIKNWLSDYTYAAGYNTHSSMDRGTYLFQNENTKKLSSYDRQRLGYILKTYDENGLVNVNETLKQIIFPEREPMQTAPRAAFSTPEMPKKPIYQPPKDIFERGREISERSAETVSHPPVQSMKISSLASEIGENKSESRIDFSSPHKFPFEKEKEVAKEIVRDEAPQPMRITPRGFKRDLGINPNSIAPSKNIVNLKE